MSKRYVATPAGAEAPEGALQVLTEWLERLSRSGLSVTGFLTASVLAVVSRRRGSGQQQRRQRAREHKPDLRHGCCTPLLVVYSRFPPPCRRGNTCDWQRKGDRGAPRAGGLPRLGFGVYAAILNPSTFSHCPPRSLLV